MKIVGQAVNVGNVSFIFGKHSENLRKTSVTTNCKKYRVKGDKRKTKFSKGKRFHENVIRN